MSGQSAAPPADPLAGVRVIELSDPGSAAQWCGRLLADAGAQVVPADTPADELDAVLAGADAVLLSDGWVARLGARSLPPAQLAATLPTAVVCCLTWYGLTGPMAGRPASELLLQAAAGIASTNGSEQEPPLQAGVPVATIAGAVFGVMGLTAALYERRTSGRGQLVDVALFDAVLCSLGTLLPAVFLDGTRPWRIGNRHSMAAPWNAYPTSDGWVVLTTMGEALWQRLAAGIGRAELVDDPRFADPSARVAHADVLDAEVAAWTGRHRTAQVLALAERIGVPAGRIPDLAEVLADPQVRARGLVVTDPATGQPAAGSPSALAAGQPAAPPDVPGPPPAPSDPPAPGGWPAPLSGVRVLELGAFTAGPLAGRLLGALGADVLKVEPPKGDNCRHLAQQLGGVSYLYYLNNTDKRGAVVDLDTPADADRLRALSRQADVVLTNLSRPVLAEHGLDDRTLRAASDSLVYCAVSGYGGTGPRAWDKAFDTVIQALGGVMAVTGWPQGPPLKVAISWADVLGACFATAGTLLALYDRQHTGRGRLVDVALLDGAVWGTQHRWAELAAGGTAGRLGNAHPTDTPHGIYPCRDGWIAVHVAQPQQWLALAELLGAGWSEPSLRDPALRRTYAATLDRDLNGWTGARTTSAAQQQLDAAGVPAARVNDLTEVAAHPQTAARQMLLEQKPDGGPPVRVLSVPWRFARTPVGVRRPAPSLAQQELAW